MNYFIFDYKSHSHFIQSFLESAAKAHDHVIVKIREWFYWKFRDSPYGETILACAEENGEIVGCVAYGIQPFWLKNKIIKGAIAFENFVHPEHQGKGIFKKLIALAEEETSKIGIEILFVFPNSKSLPGYERMKWSKLPSPEYWIKGRSIFTIPFSLKEIRQGFKPNSPNFGSLYSPSEFKQQAKEILTSVILKEYLEWRFFTFPVTEYVILDSKTYYSIVRMGTRGNVKEGQVLFINIKDKGAFEMKQFLKHCKRKTNYDIISFPISKNNPIRKDLKKSFFVRVPNKTNICYKILNPKGILDQDIKNISLSAINYHTY